MKTVTTKERNQNEALPVWHAGTFQIPKSSNGSCGLFSAAQVWYKKTKDHGKYMWKDDITHMYPNNRVKELVPLSCAAQQHPGSSREEKKDSVCSSSVHHKFVDLDFFQSIQIL